MTEWSQAVWICVNLLVMAFVMLVSVTYMSMGQEINRQISKQESSRQLMKEYREFNGVNNKLVYSQDAVSIVLHYRGTVAIRLMTSNTNCKASWCTDDNIVNVLESGVGIKNNIGESVDAWSFNNMQSNYTTEAVSKIFDVNRTYYGEVTYGPNGEVLGVTFKQGKLDDAGNFHYEG